VVLALCGAVYGARPPAWLVGIPVSDLGAGEGLSAIAAAQVEPAARRVLALAQDRSGQRAPAVLDCGP
jgi:hypothetical protein